MAKEVRLGIIGTGGIGTFHSRYLLKNEVNRCRLAAVCDVKPDRMARFADLPRFEDSRKLIRSGYVDAVLIATPHYDHTTISIDALNNGIHVLTEKPIAVHKADALRMIQAHRRRRKLVFSAMYMMRTYPFYKKIRKLIKEGEMGTIQRVNWVITDWFRTDYYYASGDWRATWRGEGGGVLMNQCPHNIDLLVWMLGLPKRVRAFCGLGKYHDIEVEDEVSAYFEYANGATGIFVTSTGEAPGTNRLEIAGDRGRLVAENGKLSFLRNEVPAKKFLRTVKESFAAPAKWRIEVPAGEGGGHHVLTQNFVDAILDGEPLIAPAEEGLGQVELGNAMLFSSLENKTVELPLNANAYAARLKKLQARSRYKKAPASAGGGDISKSFR